MTHQESIDTVIYWLHNKGYYIEVDRTGDDSVDRDIKIVSINSTRSLETQLYILLHECGHILVSESDSLVNGAEEVLGRYGERTKIYKVFTVIEEVEAWKQRDAIENFEKRMVQLGTMTQKQIQAVHDSVLEDIEEAIKFANESPYPEASELLANVYCEEEG